MSGSAKDAIPSLSFRQPDQPAGPNHEIGKGMARHARKQTTVLIVQVVKDMVLKRKAIKLSCGPE